MALAFFLVLRMAVFSHATKLLEPDDYACRASIIALGEGHVALCDAQFHDLAGRLRQADGDSGMRIVQWTQLPEAGGPARRTRAVRSSQSPLRRSDWSGSRRSSAAAFLERALAFFANQGVRVERLLTDHGSPYLSYAFRDRRAAHGLRHLRTRPRRPHTNGKAEAFVKTLQNVWAYRRPYDSSAERIASLPGLLA